MRPTGRAIDQWTHWRLCGNFLADYFRDRFEYDHDLVIQRLILEYF